MSLSFIIAIMRQSRCLQNYVDPTQLHAHRILNKEELATWNVTFQIIQRNTASNVAINKVLNALDLGNENKFVSRWHHSDLKCLALSNSFHFQVCKNIMGVYPSIIHTEFIPSLQLPGMGHWLTSFSYFLSSFHVKGNTLFIFLSQSAYVIQFISLNSKYINKDFLKEKHLTETFLCSFQARIVSRGGL